MFVECRARGGRCNWGAHTNRLSWVSSTATPASTLPTVREINMVVVKLLTSGVYKVSFLETLPEVGFSA